MKITMPKGLTRAYHRTSLKIRKHSPEILLGAGIVSLIGAAVVACTETPTARAIVDEAKSDLSKVKTCVDDPNVEYSEETHKKDLVIIYSRTAINLVKTYGPALLLGIAGTASILASHGIMKKRNLALTAAYAAAMKDLKDYRDRVVKRFGENVDKQLRFGTESKEIEETTVDENGEVKTEKKVTDVMECPSADFSEFARCFDEKSRYYKKNAEMNLYFLRAIEHQANDKLILQGHMFLNELYDMLDIPRTQIGQTVGWIYDPKNNTEHDNYISLGIYDASRPGARDFVNGYERAIWIDPNVDGTILDKI